MLHLGVETEGALESLGGFRKSGEPQEHFAQIRVNVGVLRLERGRALKIRKREWKVRWILDQGERSEPGITEEGLIVEGDHAAEDDGGVADLALTEELQSESGEQKLYLFDAKKIMAPTFGAVRGKKLGEVVSAGPEGVRIHAQGGFVEVSRLRLGDGAKVKSSEIELPVGTILGLPPAPPET